MRQWPLSLHSKTAKMLKMAMILPILKILQKIKNIFFYQYSIGGKIRQICQNVPKTAASKLKKNNFRIIFYLNSFLLIWIKVKKKDFVYFEF